MGRAGGLAAGSAGAVAAHGAECLGRYAGPRFSGSRLRWSAVERTGRRVTDIGCICPLALVPGAPVAWVVAFVLLALLSEFCGVVAVLIGPAAVTTVPG